MRINIALLSLGFSLSPTSAISLSSRITKRSMSKVVDATQEINTKGAFVRTDSIFRDKIEKGGKHEAEAGRYGLLISHACPWANRCYAVRNLKGLQDVIEVHVTHPTWSKTKPSVPDSEDAHCGWQFNTGAVSNSQGFGSFQLPGCTEAPTYTKHPVQFIRDLYPAGQATKFTVPILYDKKLGCIVNNESSEIMRMLNSDFADFATGKYKDVDLYPESKRAAIDEINELVYHSINNGVYKCGFAKSQEAYEEAMDALFSALDQVDAILAKTRFLVGGALPTEADVRLLMTLARFDEVYVVYFKTNVKRISDYPSLHQYCRDMYQVFDGTIGDSIHMDHIKTHYFTSHPALNPYAVIPRGPSAEADLRDRKSVV